MSKGQIGEHRLTDEQSVGREGRPQRVLTVLVDEDLRLAVQLGLGELADFDVFSFATAEEAVVFESPGEIDTCLVDDDLIPHGGLTLGVMLRQLYPRARVILFSSEPTPKICGLAEELGLSQLVTKPVEADDILEMLTS